MNIDFVISPTTPRSAKQCPSRYTSDDFDHSPLIVFYEVTQACDLVCRHCRACASPCASTTRVSRLSNRYVSLHHADGVLTIRGRLPSFYMKQILQTLLRDLDGVKRINNQTDVVSATGLSSVRNRRT